MAQRTQSARLRLGAAMLAALAAQAFPALAQPGAKSASGLPVPRFVSLKSDKVNVRVGPTKDNDVTWTYTRAGLPVEITAEYDNWRRIRDWEGAEGWVYHSLLSGRRTAIVTANPHVKDPLVALHDNAERHSAVTAKLQPGVVATVKRCTGSECRITGDGFDGWIDQQRLFGVYPNEKFD